MRVERNVVDWQDIDQLFDGVVAFATPALRLRDSGDVNDSSVEINSRLLRVQAENLGLLVVIDLVLGERWCIHTGDVARPVSDRWFVSMRTPMSFWSAIVMLLSLN